jgi:hypothetical protein
VDCKETLEYISAIVDKEFLPDKERRGVLSHIDICKGCRGEYELEVMTKTIVQMRVKVVAPPSRLVNSILQQMVALEAQPSQPRNIAQRVRAMLSSPRLRPAFAIAAIVIVAVVGILIFKNTTPSNTTIHSSHNDVITQSLYNYNAVIRGEIRLQKASADPEEIKRFFRDGGVAFTAHVPRLNVCELLGGVISEHNGVKLAHVLYRKGKSIIYVYQADMDVVMEGKRLDLADEAKTRITSGKWYVDDQRSDCHTLCSAVANMKKEELVAVLTTR